MKIKETADRHDYRILDSKYIYILRDLYNFRSSNCQINKQLTEYNE